MIHRSQLIALLLLGCGFAAGAQAASFDCKKAATPVEKTVCADADLSAADDRLAERFAAALARSLDPAWLREEQRNWLARLARDEVTTDRLATVYRVRIGVLDREIADAERLASTRDVTESEARHRCPALFDEVPSVEADCAVDTFGEIGTFDGKSFCYGLYALRAKAGDDPVETRAVIYQRRGQNDPLRVVMATGGEGAFYSAPKIVRLGGRILLHVPGYESGTGNFNDERLFVWRGGAWADIDATAWLGELAKQLPAGYGAWKGIFPDYRRMTAATPLWRENIDGNCCPTGGRADITLVWQGERIGLKTVKVKLGAKYAGQF